MTSPRAKPTRRKADKSGTAETRRPDHAELLLRVTDEMAVVPALDDQLERLISIATEAIPSDRGTLFLLDSSTGELYSRVAQGDLQREIRIMSDAGIAGHVFQSGAGAVIGDVANDPRCESSVDKITGYVTRNMICAPIRTKKNRIIGVAQLLNKKGRSKFTARDLELLEALLLQASIVLKGTLLVEEIERNRQHEAELLSVVAEVSSELKLGPLLQMIMDAVTKMLNAERSTLFLNDEKSNELYTEIGQGLGATKIRFPNNVGIAGTVFQTRKSVNIPHAYADLRFNPGFDRTTGFFTRSLLCVPVMNKDGKTIGVTQVLNKIGGAFTLGDEARLKAFTAQISIGLENAKLFEDVQQMKNYNESILESMSAGVITFDDARRIVTCNRAGLDIFRVEPEAIVGVQADTFFVDENAWVVERLQRAMDDGTQGIAMDAAMRVEDDTLSVNVTVLPLTSGQGKTLGSMMLIEDISAEKRMKSTMSRYMDPVLADRLLEGGEEILGGLSSMATVLFSDVRSFTTVSEELGPQATVALLNEYFTLMVDCLTREGGMLDKFIGDAIMAVFGTPFAHEDDPDRAVRTAIAMMRELTQFNTQRVQQGLRPIDIGIGLNTDQVLSGNIGSPKRMDYTVIGDGVNLAARLESACKQYGANILISDFTFNELRGTYRSREIDYVVVKGKTEPVRIHELLDFHTPETFPAVVDVLGHFRNGLQGYRQGNWERAMDAFRAAQACNPDDRLCQIYLDRCKHLRDNPPAGDWHGVWVMDKK